MMAHELEFDVLDEGQVAAALGGLPGWERDGVKIRKQYVFESFPAAIAFVNRVAGVAEEFNHHPDIEVHFKKVDVLFWTHKKNATTQADVVVSGAIEKVQ
jgi:4a-hydroxytetrahydrobiopterin dehydratase